MTPFPVSALSISESETTATTQLPPQPLAIPTKFPLGAPCVLRGTVMRETMLGERKRVATPAGAGLPKGVSVGDVIKKHHPGAQGKEIGEMVKKVREWAKDNDGSNVEAMEEFVKGLALNT